MKPKIRKTVSAYGERGERRVLVLQDGRPGYLVERYVAGKVDINNSTDDLLDRACLSFFCVGLGLHIRSDNN